MDSTYYALPSERAVAGWIERTPDGFVFNVKAYAPLTQHTLDVRTLPPALRDDLPGRLRSQSRLYARDTPLWFTRTLWQHFRTAVRPLHEAGKLGAILLQFPPWFRISRANRDYITQIRKWLPDYRLAVEFRHISWLQERSRQQTLDHLAEHEMTYVCVDEPQGFRSSVPPIVAATNPALGMVRLHGRNRAAWAAPGQHGAEQSKYRYSPAELNEWLPKVQELAAATAQTHVLFNNCFADNGVSNAMASSPVCWASVYPAPRRRATYPAWSHRRRNSTGVRCGATGPNPRHGVPMVKDLCIQGRCAGHWRELAQRSQAREDNQGECQHNHASADKQRRSEANAAAERTAEKRTQRNHAEDDDAAGGIHPTQ